MEASQYSQSTIAEPSYPLYHAPIKVVHFDPNCKKCHGTGRKRNFCVFRGPLYKRLPCRACYQASGVCYKCLGTQVNKKGEPCKQCMIKTN